ncbi:MAG TPA: L-serine ammonia-lyase, iron-sulfur-dependent subunit beta [Negativicutes bacterium]|nr:L-serine ammonia-lyase, iron-sulfur-dependent subunit beta [Negativicutes bacterium]
MNLFDVIGPIMIGPSSSHTAGAVRLGRLALALLGESVRDADIGLHGSFASTGRGHGTDRALVAGLMGWDTDDSRIPHSFEFAAKAGLTFHFETVCLGDDAHPNTVVFALKGKSEGVLRLTGCSVGGGRIKITELNGFPLELTGEFSALITLHHDRPGVIHSVTGVLASRTVNVAEMRVSRRKKGSTAVMVIDVDGTVPQEVVDAVACLPQIIAVRRLNPVVV